MKNIAKENLIEYFLELIELENIYQKEYRKDNSLLDTKILHSI